MRPTQLMTESVVPFRSHRSDQITFHPCLDDSIAQRANYIHPTDNGEEKSTTT